MSLSSERSEKQTQRATREYRFKWEPGDTAARADGDWCTLHALGIRPHHEHSAARESPRVAESSISGARYLGDLLVGEALIGAELKSDIDWASRVRRHGP